MIYAIIVIALILGCIILYKVLYYKKIRLTSNEMSATVFEIIMSQSVEIDHIISTLANILLF